MMHEVTIMNVKSVKATVSQPKDCLGTPYCTTRLEIETTSGPVRITLIGESSSKDPMHRVYPFVELERPDVEED
jgi:hypothetical protein